MSGAHPDPRQRANPLSATSRQSPAARRARQDAVVLLAGGSILEVAAWSVAWLLDWQVIALAGAVALSMGIAVAAVLMLGRKPRG